jgi:hypothetical protein
MTFAQFIHPHGSHLPTVHGGLSGLDGGHEAGRDLIPRQPTRGLHVDSVRQVVAEQDLDGAASLDTDQGACGNVGRYSNTCMH